MITSIKIWSDAAKASTLQAAVLAGIPENGITLVSEPEAAALSALKDVLLKTCKAGDGFVVADCGGGTVDLISYEVISVKPYLEVGERVSGTGGMCGSSFLNRNFEKLVRGRIGDRYIHPLATDPHVFEVTVNT
jgi:actin-like ATPase involved in cell morphogenesis